MPGPFETFVPILAQKAAPAAGSESFLPTIIMFLPVVILFYFMILRPQQAQEKKRRSMIEALKKNDRVLTSSGIYGTVVSIDPQEDRVVLRVDDDRGVKLTFSKASVARVVDAAAEKVTDLA